MAMKKNGPGNCCCGGDCTSCDTITQLLVSNLGHAALGTCAAHCSSRNGTYLFRSSPWSTLIITPGACVGRIYQQGGNSNCEPNNPFGEDRWRLSPGLQCGPPSYTWGFYVEIYWTGSVWRARVQMNGWYESDTDFVETPGPIFDGTYTRKDQRWDAEWRIESETCDGLAGTPLTLYSFVDTPCGTFAGLVGDICNVQDAVIELG